MTETDGPHPIVRGFYERRTGSIQYVASCPRTRRCAIIDPVLDFDEKSGATATHCADEILEYVRMEGLSVEWILDTHPHADHFSAAQYLKERTGAPTAIGKRVVEVQRLWKALYGFVDLPTDGSQWDRTFAEGDAFSVGEVPARVLFSPGHSPKPAGQVQPALQRVFHIDPYLPRPAHPRRGFSYQTLAAASIRFRTSAIQSASRWNPRSAY